MESNNRFKNKDNQNCGLNVLLQRRRYIKKQIDKNKKIKDGRRKLKKKIVKS